MPELFGNRYEVIERVGDGGMATVYRGIDHQLKREVAIKVMHPHLAARKDARLRFSREAENVARVKHPNIVDVYDSSAVDDEKSYMITEFVHGETLSSFVAGHGPFLPQCAALVGHAIAGALYLAHQKNLVHRDIKPDNLMVSVDGQIKLMDFGISSALDTQGLTATGAIVGSPAHMAPEQIEGEEVDHRADLFAFGIVLYFLVTRRLPFAASNPQALFRQILEGTHDPASHHNPAVDRQFEAIIEQCLSRYRADRFANAQDLQAALAQYLKQFRMSDVATLLPRFLKGPELFAFDVRPALVQEWTVEGRRLAGAGQLALAIDAFNRALAIDPEADDPKKGLSELTARTRRRRQLTRAATVLAVVMVAIGASAAVAVWLEPLPHLPKWTGPARAVATQPLPAGPNIASPLVVVAELPVVVAAAPAPPPTPTMVADSVERVVLKSEDFERARPHKRDQVTPERPGSKKGPPTLQADPKLTPLPVVEDLVDVQLSCVPASGALRFHGTLYDGVAMLKLRPGMYTFTCTFPENLCLECHPVMRPFTLTPPTNKDDKRMFKAFMADARG